MIPHIITVAVPHLFGISGPDLVSPTPTTIADDGGKGLFLNGSGLVGQVRVILNGPSSAAHSLPGRRAESTVRG
jgi:hypothetical protein